MTSTITTSELALAQIACERLLNVPRPRVLIGGLGLGFTLRAALDVLPPHAQVTVAELNERVITWCKGPAAQAANRAANDHRVRFFVGDVTHEIQRVAEDESAPRYDAILWDLYVGPTRRGGDQDPLYGNESVARTADALSVGGVFGVWSETPSKAFEERMRKFALRPELLKTGGSGLRHAVLLGTKQKPRPPKKPALKRGRKI